MFAHGSNPVTRTYHVTGTRQPGSPHLILAHDGSVISGWVELRAKDGGFILTFTQQGLIKASQDLGWPLALQAAVVLDSSSSHFSPPRVYNGPAPPAGSQFPVKDMSSSLDTIPSRQLIQIINQVQARKALCVPSAGFTSGLPNRLRLWYMPAAPPTVPLPGLYSGPSANGRGLDPVGAARRLWVRMETATARIPRYGLVGVSSPRCNEFEKTINDFISSADGIFNMNFTNDLLIVAVTAQCDLRHFAGPLYDEKIWLEQVNRDLLEYNAANGIARNLINQNGNGIVSYHFSGPDPRKNTDADSQYQISRDVLPRSLHHPPPHDIVNGSRERGEHLHYTMAVRGRHMLHCYHSRESHTWLYHFLLDHVRQGGGYYDITDNNSTYRSGGLFIRVIEKPWYTTSLGVSNIDYNGMRK